MLFRSEIKFIQDNGGIVIRVKRGDEPEWYQDVLNVKEGPKNMSYSISKSNLKRLGIHQSETDWIGSDFDYIVENNGTITDLGNKVNELLQFIR